MLIWIDKGCIINASINAPGSWHDSRVALSVYLKLHHNTPEGFYIIADTAFPRGAIGSASKIRAPMKMGQRLPADRQRQEEVLAFDRQLVSFRQSAEWGMRQMRGSFGRLRLPLDANDDQGRKDLLTVCVRMNNVRARRVRISEIRSVYDPIWNPTEDEDLWRGFEDMLFRDIRRHDRVARFHHVAAE